MVIKSKNSRKVKIIKIIAVILAMISGTAALFSGIFTLYTGSVMDSPEYLFDRTQRHNFQTFMSTNPVGQEMLIAASDTQYVLSHYKGEEYFQNVYLPQLRAELEQEQEKYIREKIIQNGLEIPTVYGSYEETTHSYYETTSSYEPATSVDGEFDTNIADPESGHDDSQTSYDKAYRYWSDQFDIEGRLTERKQTVRSAISRLNENVDLKIYAVNSADGSVYTNVTGPDPASTISALTFALRYQSSDRTVEQLAGLPNATLNDYLELHPDGDDYGDDIEIYLGVDPENLTGMLSLYYDTYQYYAGVLDFSIPALFAGGILFLLSLIAAICLAGRGPLPETGTEVYRRKVERFGGTITGREPVLRNGFDAIPNDLHLILSLGLGVCAFIGVEWSVSRMSMTNFVGPTATLLLFSLALILILVELCMSISRNAKAGHYWRRTLLASMGRGFKRLGRWFKYQFSPLGHHFKSLPRYILRLLIAYFVVMIPLSLIPFLPIFINIFVVLFLWRSMASLDRLMKYAHEIQSGTLNVTIDTANFPKWMVPFAQDIIHLRDGMQAAVDEALKSERLKTELITNVSHDLKTPLTSIINYTGLLAKCDIPDPQAQDYIAVLQNKSDRLKHLIEDLVEASKASTGNVEFHPIRLNLYEMAVQAVGENEDALANQGVTVVINEPEQQPVVQADSQKTWRVVENLLSNVRKYSVPGTRAYIDVRTEGSFGVLTVKNISREELNISPEELMERFVRGDESRSTEGSGLGLSIAQNLCEKQGGQFRIDIDGDLFKATVRLPLAPEQSTMPESIQTSTDPTRS